MRIRQYYNSSSDEYYEAMEWTPIETSGAQQFLFNVDNTAVAAGGPTIMDLRLTSPGMSNFSTNTKATFYNWYEVISHWVPETRITTICDEKDTYRFGWNTHER